MSERPTPETDALASEHRGAVIWPDFARRLERERDEAREELEWRMNWVKALRRVNRKLMLERDALQEQLDAAIMLGKMQERERDEARSDLEFRRGLFKLQEEQLNGVRSELDRIRKQCDQYPNKMDSGWHAVIEERDQYRGLLIRLYNDLFVHHKGEAVREFKELFREENYN